MTRFRKLMQALALGAAFLAIPLAAPRTAQAQFFDKPGYGGGYGYAPPPPVFYAPPPRVFIPPPVYYAPPPQFYSPPPPRAFYGAPRAFYGPRPYFDRPHGHRRHW